MPGARPVGACLVALCLLSTARVGCGARRPGSAGKIRVVSIGGVGTSYLMAYMHDIGFHVAQSGKPNSIDPKHAPVPTSPKLNKTVYIVGNPIRALHSLFRRGAHFANTQHQKLQAPKSSDYHDVTTFEQYVQLVGRRHCDMFGIEAHFDYFASQPNVHFDSVHSINSDPRPIAAYLNVDPVAFQRITVKARHPSSLDGLGSAAAPPSPSPSPPDAGGPCASSGLTLPCNGSLAADPGMAAMVEVYKPVYDRMLAMIGRTTPPASTFQATQPPARAQPRGSDPPPCSCANRLQGDGTGIIKPRADHAHDHGHVGLRCTDKSGAIVPYTPRLELRLGQRVILDVPTPNID